MIDAPEDFIRKVPHMSFVRGEDGVDFLANRFKAMAEHHFFSEMTYSEDVNEIGEWAPLLAAGREEGEKIAATRVDGGTDIDFGSLTQILINYLTSLDGVTLATETSVRDIDRTSDGGWKVRVRRDGELSSEKVYGKFVFIGAGEVLSSCSKNREYAKVKALADSPSVANSWSVRMKKLLRSMLPRSTVEPLLAHHRCQFPTSTLG